MPISKSVIKQYVKHIQGANRCLERAYDMAKRDVEKRHNDYVYKSFSNDGISDDEIDIRRKILIEQVRGAKKTLSFVRHTKEKYDANIRTQLMSYLRMINFYCSSDLHSRCNKLREDAKYILDNIETVEIKEIISFMRLAVDLL